ncbi:MAG TPA: FtsX-like permease family protein, partial [bacterium]|nr:FtsX-like permease family protein [bacterium]
RRFGTLWIARSAVDRAFDMQGSFNDVVLALAPEASPGSVAAAVDAVLAPYGGTGAFGREDQPSARLVDGELDQNRAMAISLPFIFLGVAAFLLNVVLGRLIGTQRSQIATLKALGFSSGEIGMHYARLAGVIVVAGSALGTLLGFALGRFEMASYQQYFRFHALGLRVESWIPLLAAAIATGAGALGSVGAVWRVIALPAAEAMRPESPPLYRRGVVERLGLPRIIPGQALLVARSIVRRPVRAALTATGIGAAVAVLVTGLFMFDAVGYFVDLSFHVAQRGDVVAGFVRPSSPRAVAELQSIPGVLRAEGTRGVPVLLRAGHREYRTGLAAFARDADLARVVDFHGRPAVLPAEGVLLSDRLAARLGLSRGDSLEVDVLEGEEPALHTIVGATYSAANGLSAAIDVRALDRLLGHAPAVSGASLTIEPGREEEVFADLARRPGIVSALPVADVIETFNQTIGGMVTTYVSMFAIFAGVIAVGVVYNAARITFAERARELASLRILGFTRREVTTLLLGELSVELVVGIPLGWGMGTALSWGAARAFENDQISMPLVISTYTYAFATAVVLASAGASAIAVRRMLNRLDLVEVLKAGE